MIVLKLILSATLIVIAALHLLWALGYWWPIKDEATLAKAVVGTKGIQKMPGAVACSLVVVALVFAAAWPWLPVTWLTTLGLVVLIVVFAVRGVMSYAPDRHSPPLEQPFKRLNKTYYAPLCVLIGIGFIAVILEQQL